MADVELLQAEIELLRAEVERVTCELMDAITRADKLEEELREAREFRDKMANAIGNDQLRRFIEKHGEPVPLTLRMQEAEARAERLAEAISAYKSEWDNPVKDYVLRARRRDEMFALLREQESK